MLIDLDMVRLGVQEKVEIVRTHPESVSCVQEVIFTGCTYDSYFATELVLDLTSLDSTRRMFLYELEEVLDTHDGCACHSIARALLGCFLSLRAEECGWRLVKEVMIARTTSRPKRVQGLRAVTARALLGQSAPHISS
jgi:hypothetical protein